MVMMAVTIAFFGVRACTEGHPGSLRFGECTVDNFPDISHLMGAPPLNKLYAIMLTVYSATKLAESRAYYNKLSTFVPPLLNGFLFFAAVVAMIAGPGIGYWDCYFDMDTHCLMSSTFTIAEVVYLYTLCGIMSYNREQFGPHAQHVITRVQYQLLFVAFVGLCMTFPTILDWGSISEIGEWLAFFSDFIIRFQIAAVIRYTSKVVKDQ